MVPGWGPVIGDSVERIGVAYGAEVHPGRPRLKLREAWLHSGPTRADNAMHGATDGTPRDIRMLSVLPAGRPAGSGRE
jgi:hypothetical protein